MLVLGGPVAGTTVTVSKVLSPGNGPEGLAVPLADSAPLAVQELVAEAVFRGVGAPIEKSALLLSDSVQPLVLLIAAVVFERVPTAVVSGQAPDP
jgi:hypothetical protein